jgi:hypothetical protein
VGVERSAEAVLGIKAASAAVATVIAASGRAWFWSLSMGRSPGARASTGTDRASTINGRSR